MIKNDQFEAINKDLEKLVEERARTIESKNNQIIDYANINAHKVRAPLARILGLINISMYELDEEELKYVLDNIEDSAKELDVILKQIAETLSEKDRHD
jgi:signal transduction histidine kinase